MEKLVALCYLWTFGLGAKEDYFTELDRLFLLSPEDDFLLELEGLGSDRAAAWARLSAFLPTVNCDEFGRVLFGVLEKFFDEKVLSKKISLDEFTLRCYTMWCGIPLSIADNEPLYTLCYAGDYPYYCDENLTLDLYRKAFDYYKEQK